MSAAEEAPIYYGGHCLEDFLVAAVEEDSVEVDLVVVIEVVEEDSEDLVVEDLVVEVLAVAGKRNRD